MNGHNVNGHQRGDETCDEPYHVSGDVSDDDVSALVLLPFLPLLFALFTVTNSIPGGKIICKVPTVFDLAGNFGLDCESTS